MKNHTLFRVIILQFSYYAIGENLAKEFYFLEGFLFETIFRDFVSRMEELIVILKNTLLFHETKEADKSEKTSNDRFYNNLAKQLLIKRFHKLNPNEVSPLTSNRMGNCVLLCLDEPYVQAL